MVLCFIALPVFAVLSIFSIKYRKLTKDAVSCIFRTATFRKCESGLDDKIRADITGTFLRFSPGLAKFFYKNYKIISWIILGLFIWATWVGGIGIYNFIKYGNCGGAQSVGVCVLNESVSLLDKVKNYCLNLF